MTASEDDSVRLYDIANAKLVFFLSFFLLYNRRKRKKEDIVIDLIKYLNCYLDCKFQYNISFNPLQ